MNLKYYIIITLVLVITSFTIGRYSSKSADSTKIVSTTDTKIDENKNTDVHKVIKTTTDKQPNGEVITTTITTQDTITKDIIKETQDTKTVTTTSNSKLNLSALVALDIHSLTPTYGASVSKQFIGPVTTGVFFLTNGTIGVSLGINF